MDKTRYADIGRKLRAIPLEQPDSSYEWEELVERLCASEDAGLHDIGIKEQGELKNRHTAEKVK
jgi:hypothetical protein